jgi:hypothetical protein
VFHVELRQFPHVARAFNLSAEELHARVIAPWVAERPFGLDDRRWDPGRAKLTIYQGRELASEELGMGRGWGTVSREGEEVTQQLLESARRREDPGLDEFKQAIMTRAEGRALTLCQVVELAGEPTWRASERLALAEQAVWELLHEERLNLIGADGARLTRDRWQPTVLSWATWAPDSGVGVSAGY